MKEGLYQTQAKYLERTNNEVPRQRIMEVDDPMEIDAIDFRRRHNFNRNNNGGVCFYCGQPGHRKARCQTRIQDI